MSNEQKLREAFEARMTDNGKWPRAVEKGRNGCYLLAQTENAWVEWQACAEALATTAPEPEPEPTSKQSLQVEPAVNQQLTTELDEREAFEREMSCEEIWGHRSLKKKPDGRYGNWCVDLMWAAWQARAAMAQVRDINAVESFTNDAKDALMAGRAYAQEALIRFDDAYDRHPSTEPERNAILTDIQLIDAAMAKEGDK